MRHILLRLTVAATLTTFAPAIPSSGLASAAPAPSGPGYTLEGCQQDGPHAGHLTFGASGPFICPDNAYTTGNLAKGWNELDLVPHRVTLAKPTAGSVTLHLGGDHLYTQGSSAVGWDVVSVPVLNVGLSGVGCPAPTDNGQSIVVSTNGGAYDTIERSVTFTGAANASGDCVYDYYQRLALGAHLYSGSSLQSYVNSTYSGEKRISLPVREAKPQELTKDMTATQDADHNWNLTKEAVPTTLGLTDTCTSSTGSSGTVQITVTWTRLAATPSGEIEVVTNVNAVNPAARTVTVSVTDQLRSGTTVLQTHTFDDVDVVAGGNVLVGTWITTVPSGTTGLNDIATGTYTDKVTGIAIPGSTTATDTADVEFSGTTSHESATITDTESITGSGLTFSVSAPSTGTFDTYTAGTATTGPVDWSSGTVSSSGSVVFNKTVYAAHGTATTSGSLDDTATLTSSPSLTRTASATTSITSTATVSLTINKTIPVVLGSGDTTQTFTFPVTGPGGYSSSPTISFGTGDGGSLHPKSTTLTGLAPGAYTVSETTLAPYIGQAPQPVTIDLPACSGSATFTNNFGPASAQVRKVTAPAGSEAGWVMTLTGPGTPAGGESVTTTGTAYVPFDTVLQEGAYTITETAQAGWDQTGASSECSFTVNYPADADRVFSCTLTNTQRGSITIVKNAVPDDPTDFGFTTTGSGLSSFSLDDDADATLSNTRSFTDLVPGSYSVTETLPVTGWDLTGLSCASTNGLSTTGTTLATGLSSITLGAGDSVTCTYTNTKRGHVTVLKTENGAVPTHAYTFRLTGGPDSVNLSRTTSAGNAGALDFGLLKPGSYTLCELAVPAGTDSTLQTVYGGTLNATTGDICLTFTLSAGQTRAFTIDNSHPLGGQRTIGYWKRWNTYTMGSTAWAKSAQTGNHLMDEFLPKSLGGYTVDTAAKGVAVLQAASAKYAENQLAAQLLAAKLNVAAGASTCATVSTAIAQANALLVTIGYTGPPSYKIGSTSPYRATALALASTLDRYNNGLIC